MKELNLIEMSTTNAGSAKRVAAEIGCFYVGLVFGAISFGLGAIMGIGCDILVHQYS
jgi:hypothetical protein